MKTRWNLFKLVISCVCVCVCVLFNLISTEYCKNVLNSIHILKNFPKVILPDPRFLPWSLIGSFGFPWLPLVRYWPVKAIKNIGLFAIDTGLRTSLFWDCAARKKARKYFFTILVWSIYGKKSDLLWKPGKLW